MDNSSSHANRKSWSFNPEVSLGSLITALAIVASTIYWGASLEGQVAVIEERQAALRVQMETEIRMTQNEVSMIRDDIKEDVASMMNDISDIRNLLFNSQVPQTQTDRR